MSKDREFYAEISELFAEILEQIYPQPGEIRPVQGKDQRYYDWSQELAAWSRKYGPYAAQTDVPDLQVGDVIAYREEEARTYRGQKDYSRVARDEDSASDFVQSVAQNWGSTSFAIVVKKNAKSVEVSQLTRPGVGYDLTRDPALLGYNPEDEYTTRLGRSSHRVIVRVGQYDEVVAQIRQSPEYPALLQVLADLKDDIDKTNTMVERTKVKVDAKSAPLKAAAAIVNEAFGFKYLSVDEPSIYPGSVERGDKFADPVLEINDYSNNLKHVYPGEDLIEEIFTGRVALGKVSDLLAQDALRILEQFVDRNEDGERTGAASRIKASDFKVEVSA
jgi:hypothetical protein